MGEQAETAWGNPVVPGTRIPIFRIRDWLDAGYSPERIASEVYPGRLTVEQICAAASRAPEGSE